jgi:hypothetical protein
MTIFPNENWNIYFRDIGKGINYAPKSTITSAQYHIT